MLYKQTGYEHVVGKLKFAYTDYQLAMESSSSEVLPFDIWLDKVLALAQELHEQVEVCGDDGCSCTDSLCDSTLHDGEVCER